MTIYTSKTDSRLVVDILAPGYKPTNIKVLKRTINDGKSTLLVVKGKYERPTGGTDKLVPKFAYDKVVAPSFKETIPVDGDYDVDGVKYAVENGVIRISVPKTKAAIGAAVAPIAAGGNVNIIDGLDSDDDDDAAPASN